MKKHGEIWTSSLVLTVLLLVGRSTWGIDIEMVTVGDAANQPSAIGIGRVNYEYRIGKYEITNVQYAAFLNAVAKDDPNGLWHELMGRPAYEGSISREGEAGNYLYSIHPREQDGLPATGITALQAARFANWLHNGQPVGAQGPDTTEDGAYTLTAESIENNTWQRNPGAKYFLPSLDEWYKAAYYKGGSLDAGYWLYPTQSDEQPVSEYPRGGTNSANYGNSTVTLVGAYAESPGPYGTFDQAGNVMEWTDSIYSNEARYFLGGAFGHQAFHDVMESSAVGGAFSVPDRIVGFYGIGEGFRIASIPEPGSLPLLLLGATLTFLRLRRRVR